LILDKRVELQPLIAGGGHERGLRSGTENVGNRGIWRGSGTCGATRCEVPAHVRWLQEKLENGLLALGASIFARDASVCPTPVILLSATSMAKRWLASWIAKVLRWPAVRPVPAPILSPRMSLMAMGVAPEMARGAVRVSLGAGNTETEIEQFINALQVTVGRLQGLTAIAV
jgi:cysteine desulfurase